MIMNFRSEIAGNNNNNNNNTNNNVEDIINLAVIGLERYVCKSNERLLTAARVANEYEGDSKAEYKLRRKNERCQAWKGKTLHGHFVRQTENEAGSDKLSWLRYTGIKRGTESIIIKAVHRMFSEGGAVGKGFFVILPFRSPENTLL